MAWVPFFTIDAFPDLHLPLDSASNVSLDRPAGLICSLKATILVKDRGTEEVFLARVRDERSCILFTGFGTVRVCSNVLWFIGERVTSVLVDEFHLRHWLCFVWCRTSLAFAASCQPCTKGQV